MMEADEVVKSQPIQFLYAAVIATYFYLSALSRWDGLEEQVSKTKKWS